MDKEDLVQNNIHSVRESINLQADNEGDIK